MGLFSLGLRSSGLLGGGDWGGERVVEEETPGSMALSVESCVWSPVFVGLVRVGDRDKVTICAGLASDEVVEVVVMVAIVVVQFGSVLALLLMEIGGW